MTNQQLMDHGHQMMDETDQSIERSKQASALQKKTAIFLYIQGSVSPSAWLLRTRLVWATIFFTHIRNKTMKSTF